MSNENDGNQPIIEPSSNPFPKGCLILLIALIALCMLPIVINTVNVLYNQFRWNSFHLDSYSVTVGIAGPGGTVVRKNVVKNGTLIVSDISGENAAMNSLYPNLKLTVNDLFVRAYECFIYTFCRVEFDKVYSYPNFIGGGFIEPAWIFANELVPENSEG